MKVKFFGPFKDLVRADDVELDSPDVEDVIRRLIAKYGSQFEDTMMVNGQVKDTILILVNGRLISDFDGMQTKLRKEDLIVILPMATGG